MIMSSKTRDLFKAGKGARKAAEGTSKFKAHPDYRVMGKVAFATLVVAAIGIYCIARAIRKRKAREEWIAEKKRMKNAHNLTGTDQVDGYPVCV
jgi:hypothetical protein